jgi:multidrug efflux pump subunit AcrA (membrane-fusion protein)
MVALFPGCKRATAKQQPPPPTVTVSQPLQREVTRWDEYSGYLSSPETVIVNARVSGLIKEAPFQQRTIVHAGDLLFKIDRARSRPISTTSKPRRPPWRPTAPAADPHD